MPQYLSPGVYVEEVPSAVKPIAGVGTSTAGFTGVMPDSIAIPRPNRHYDPTRDTEASTEVGATVEDLLGQTLAQDITMPAEETLLVGTVLDEQQAQAIKARGERVTVTYKQGIDDPLLDKTLAENVTDDQGNVIHVEINGEDKELRKGYKVARGEVGPIQEALSKAGINEISVQETVDVTKKEADYLVGKTLAEDVTITETLSAGTVVGDQDLAQRIVEAVGEDGKLQVKNLPFVKPKFSPVGAGEVKLCTNFGEFKKFFGDFSADPGQKRLAHAVYGFFNNGGTRCYVMRVASESDITTELLKTTFGPIDEIALVAVPGVTDKGVQQAILDHCQDEHLQDRFAILDSLPELKDPSDSPTKENVQEDVPNSSYGAIYFPWIQVFDPAQKTMYPDGDGRIYVPPSGHMAGVYARVDAERGVHKAPANEVVRGALDLKYRISKAQQGPLNEKGINCIRAFDGNVTVWGARTLGGDDNLEWKYINVRRLFLFLRESIDKGTQWVVFEPNDPGLWAKITRNVTAFLTNVWRAGALFGDTPQQAFYVKCDEETNPPEVRDLGQVVTEIGVAVVKPAEFVVFRISQWAGPGG